MERSLARGAAALALAAGLLAGTGAGGAAHAQQPAGGAATGPAAAPASVAAPAPAAAPAAAPAPTAGPTPAGGPASANIFDVQAESQAVRQRVQPLNNAPVWREVNSGGTFTTTLPRAEGGVLIQREGEAWRQLRNGPITTIGGWLLVAAVLGVSLLVAWRRTTAQRLTETGRRIERFTLFERTAHWAMAISFVLLALTGLTLLFGKFVLLPVFGHTLFSVLATLSKAVHNFIGPLFGLSLLVFLVAFIRDNIPRGYDLQWLRAGGGLFSGKHVPSHRFNMGEKTWFWIGVVVLGVLVTVTGLVLNFPNFEQTRAQMQLAWTIHVIASLLFVVGAMGHSYMGTVGVPGAYDAMRHGYVDEAWAKEHHEYWYNDVKAGRIPAQRTQGSAPPGSRLAT